MARIRIKHAGKILSWLIRGIACTLEIKVTDDAGVLNAQPRAPVILAFWHNRLFLLPYLKQRWEPHVPGCILTSPSGDGQIIADICAEFGFEAARGSSSKPEKGMSALIKLADRVKAGYDIGITPDGPRGPRYVLGPGLIKLAQLTGAALMPVHVHYEKAWQFRTWDGFLLPKPFSKVHVRLGEITQIPRRLTEDAFDQALAQFQERMREGT